LRRAQVVPPEPSMRELTLDILGRDAEKQIETALGCTPATAHRILYHQRPDHLIDRLIEFLDRRLARNREAIDRDEQELKAIRYARMVSRAKARRAAADETHPQMAARPGRRP